jgi:CubicO group peptidase (beta-lactamase class C family)
MSQSVGATEPSNGRWYKHQDDQSHSGALLEQLRVLPAQGQPFRTSIESPDKSVPSAIHEYNVPGLAVALIRNGGFVWMKGYGFADVASAKPTTPNTAI